MHSPSFIVIEVENATIEFVFPPTGVANWSEKWITTPPAWRQLRIVSGRHHVTSRRRLPRATLILCLLGEVLWPRSYLNEANACPLPPSARWSARQPLSVTLTRWLKA